MLYVLVTHFWVLSETLTECGYRTLSSILVYIYKPFCATSCWQPSIITKRHKDYSCRKRGGVRSFCCGELFWLFYITSCRARVPACSVLESEGKPHFHSKFKSLRCTCHKTQFGLSSYFWMWSDQLEWDNVRRSGKTRREVPKCIYKRTFQRQPLCLLWPRGFPLHWPSHRTGVRLFIFLHMACS